MVKQIVFLNSQHPFDKRLSRVLMAEKLTSKEIYDILIFKVVNKRPSDLFFEELFKVHKTNWQKKYCIPGITTYKSYIQGFNLVQNLE